MEGYRSKFTGQEIDEKLENSSPIVLNISVENNTFMNVSDFQKVHEKMKKGEYVNFVIRSVFNSGTAYIHIPTTIKANYISLSSRAGNCELHVNNDGTFTIAGTKPW